MQMIPTYIPTYGRAGKVTTLSVLPRCAVPILVVRRVESAAYDHAYPGITQLVMPQDVKGITATRTFIMRHVVKWSSAVAMMMDDDIRRWHWKHSSSLLGGLRDATEQEVQDTWQHVYRVVTMTRIGAAVAFADRVTLARPNPKCTPRIGPLRQCVMFNRKAARMARFSLPMFSDMEASLQWMLDGVWARQDPFLGQTSPSSALRTEQGGCGPYRARHPEYFVTAYRRFKRMFPKYVDLEVLEGGVIKKRIAWSRAVQDGLR